MQDIIEAVKELSFGEAVGGGALITLFLSVCVDISPIKLNPWKHIARAFGKAINGEVIKELGEVKQSQDELWKALNQSNEQRERRDAIDCRTRIIRFGDELLHNTVEHSKEAFDVILTDITNYENYCKEHEDFPNNVAVMTIRHIKEVYQRCWELHKFL